MRTLTASFILALLLTSQAAAAPRTETRRYGPSPKGGFTRTCAGTAPRNVFDGTGAVCFNVGDATGFSVTVEELSGQVVSGAVRFYDDTEALVGPPPPLGEVLFCSSATVASIPAGATHFDVMPGDRLDRDGQQPCGSPSIGTYGTVTVIFSS